MPVDYSNCPSNWKTVIRPRILQRAENACEICSTVNYTLLGTVRCCPDPAFDGQDKCIVCGKRRPKVVLTIAHLDHDVTNNNDDNLKALCQRCHLKHDACHHAKNARRTRELKSGQMALL